MTEARSQARQFLAELAQKAKETLGPESHGRIDCAVKLTLAGDVQLLPDGVAVVASGTDPLTTYRVNGECECQDFPRAPGQWCKHKIARALMMRLGRLLPPSPHGETAPVIEVEATPVPLLPAVPLPEMPFSVTLKGMIDGQDALLTARGRTAAEFHANLEAIRGLLDPAPVKAQPASTDDTPQCPNGHGALKRSTKGKGYFCTTKRSDGTWCPGK